MKPSRQRRLAGAERARYESGKPPRSHSRSQVVHLPKPEAVQLVERNAPGQRLGRLTEELRGRAPQHEESGRCPRPVREDAQQREHVGKPLDLVEHHQSTQGSQLESGIGESREIGRVLQVEPRRPTAVRCRELPGESGLPDLTSAEESDDRELVQQQAHAAQVMLSGNLHGVEI